MKEELDKPEVREVDESDEDYQEVRAWPTRAEAARQYGLSQRWFELKYEQGVVTKIRCDGVQRFCPDDIENLRPRSPDSSVIVSDVLQETTKALKASNAHIEALVTKTVGLVEVLTKGFQTQLDAMVARNATLEKSHAEALQAREEALSQAHERNMIEQEQIRDDRRKDTLLQFLIQQLGPRILSGLSGKESRLVASFSRDQLEALLESGMLTDEQSELLKVYLSTKPQGGEAAGNPTEKEDN